MTRPIDKQQTSDLLDYNLVTGEFTWKKTPGRSNPMPVGSKAGHVTSHGYLRIVIAGRSYMAHRLAWLIVTGDWPKNDIDHIDGNRLNNAFKNLRDVGRNVNSQNLKGPQKNNRTSGLLGVSFRPRVGKFIAQITVDKKVIYLGAYLDPNEAHLAYLKAKRTYHEGNTL